MVLVSLVFLGVLVTAVGVSLELVLYSMYLCGSPVWRSSRLCAVVATVPDAISISLWVTVGLFSNVTVFLVSWRFLTSVARVGTMNEPLVGSDVSYREGRVACLGF